MGLIGLKDARIEIQRAVPKARFANIPRTEMIYIWEIKPFVPDWGNDKNFYRQLCDSIMEIGLMNPPQVRRLEDGSYEIIDGQLRILAARACGIYRILVIVNHLSDKEVAEYRRSSS